MSPARPSVLVIASAILGLVPSAGGQSLAVEPSVLDFGVVKLGDRLTRQVELRNTGKDEQEVKVSVAGDAYATTADTLTIAAGAASLLAIELTAADLGEHLGELTVQAEGFFRKEPLTVQLTARVARPKITVTPRLEFADRSLGERDVVAVEILNEGEVALAIEAIRVEPDTTDFAAAPAAPFSVAPGATRSVAVTFSPAAGGRRVAQLVILSSELESGEVQVALEGFGTTPVVAFSPRPEVGLEFDQIEVGQRRRRALVILSQGQADLKIDRIDLSGGPFSIDWDSSAAVTVPPAGRLDVGIEFRPRYEGVAAGNLAVHSNDPARPRVDIPVSGRAAVTPPAIEILNDSDLDFGNVPLSTTASDLLLIWNRGGTPYTVRTDVESPFAGEFEIETASLLLQPGTYAKMEVRFKPRERGERRGALTVHTESGPHRIEMYGIGNFLELTPSAVDFDRVVVGKSTPQQIELLNIGNSDFDITNVRSSNTPNFRVKSTVSTTNRFVLPAHGYQPLPISVTFSPTARGLVNGTLQVEGYWDQTFETRELLLSGTGIAADLELHPSSNIDLGYTVLGEEEAQTLVATNTGDTDLRVVARSESPEARCEPDSFSLRPGQSTTLQVIFAPQALGQRSARVQLISNDVTEKALPLSLTGKGALGNVDLTDLVALLVSRKSRFDTLKVGWNNTPSVLLDGSKIDLVFHVPDSLRPALVGREFDISWRSLDENYDETGGSKNTKLKIHDSGEDRFLAEKFNLRLTEKDNRRVRISIATRNYPGAPEQKISQVLQAGGWKWEFEAKPLVSFLSVRPSRDYKDENGNTIKGKTERLIGLPGFAFFGYHNSENPSISGVHLTATGNVLEALSTSNSLAISLGVAVSMYKDRFMFGLGYDVYDHRPKAVRKGTQDYIMTFKYWGLF